jgi:benzil reductase ((S)-benzoin forming)
VEAERTLFVVTGASSGIGSALAQEAARCGFTVASCSRRRGPGEHLAVDLGDPGEWRRFARWLEELIAGGDWGRVVLVHAAATLEPIGFAGEVDPDAYQANVLLNSAAPQVIGDAFLRAMAGSPAAGVLLQLSSGAGRTARAGWTSYGAGKAAVDHWVRHAGLEQDERGGRVRVLSVAPGVVETDMQAKIRSTRPEDFPQVDDFVALHRRGELAAPDDVARRLLALIERTDLANGAAIDLRQQ